MAEDIKIRITADATGVKTGTAEAKRELEGIRSTGVGMATGLKASFAGIALALAPLAAAMAVIRGIGAFIKVADEAMQADKKIQGLADKTSAAAPSMSSAFTAIRNAVVMFVVAVNNGTGVVGGIGRVISEVAQVIAIFARQIAGASSESDKIKNNRGAIEFAQGVGKAFAYMGDLISAIARAAIDTALGIVNAFRTVGNVIGGVAAAIAQAARGDFGAAAGTIRATMADAGRSIGGMADTAVSNFDRLTAAVKGGGEALTAYRAQLANGTSIDLSKTDKKDGGDTKEASNSLIARQIGLEIDAIQKAIDADRKRFQVAQDVTTIRMSMDRDRALAAIEAEQRVNRFQLDNQQITQQQYLAAELVFEEQKYQIRAAAVQRQLELAKAEGRDPVEVERINAQLLQLELDFQQRKQQIGLEVQAAGAGKGGATGQVAGSAWDAMKQSMGSALDSMLTRAKTFGQAMAGVWGNMRAAILNEVGKILMAKVAAFAKEKLLAMAHISAEGAKAGAGAAASQASIPIVGPAMGLAAMASMLASVLGLAGGIKSAAGGFDIPAGLNPMTQLHAEEMVLPANIANPLRESLSNGGMGGSAPPIELRGVSAGEFFIASRKDLVAALKSAHREFAFS